MGGTNAKCFHVRFVAALDPGCVKTLEAIVGAQQKNRSHSLDESFMRGRPSLCINLVPERPIEWFSHSQDPKGKGGPPPRPSGQRIRQRPDPRAAEAE